MVYFELNTNQSSDYIINAGTHQMLNTFHTKIYKCSTKHKLFPLITAEGIPRNSSNEF